MVRTSNQGSFVDRATKLHNLAVTRRLFGPAGEKWFKIAYIGSYMDTRKMPRKLIYATTLKLLYMEVLLESKILAGPKTLSVTARVGSFESFFYRWTEKPPCNCQGMQLC